MGDTGKHCTIYEILNTHNGKRYIGSTSRKLEARKREHVCALRSGKHINVKLQRSWNLHGEDCFVFNVLEMCSVDEILDREQYYMDKYNVCEVGYNIVKNAKFGFFARNEEDCKEYYGENSSVSIYKEEQIIECKKMMAEHVDPNEIEEVTGVSKHNIINISNMVSWKYVGSQYNESIVNIREEKRLKKKEKKDCVNRCSLEYVKNKQKYKTMESIHELCESYGLLYRDIVTRIIRYKRSKIINFPKIECNLCGVVFYKAHTSEKYCCKCKKGNKRKKPVISNE